MAKTSAEKNEKPRVFIGSSVEGLQIANNIQLLLEHTAEPTVWTQGVFEATGNTLDDLIDLLDKVDFGIFVFSPDDIAKIRKQRFLVARDNVIFEMGLFIGRIGKKRTFYIIPRYREKFHIPSDLIGVMALDYDNNRSDGNIQAALGSPCTKIIERITQLGRYEKSVAVSDSISKPPKSIFPPQEEIEFNFVYSKLNNFNEAKCHVSIQKDLLNENNEKAEIKEKGCLFKYSFLEVLSKNVLSGAIRYDDDFLDFIKFEEHESFKTYLEQGYKFGTKHIGNESKGLLTSLGILIPEFKEDSSRFGSRDYAIYRFSEKAYRFVLWLDYHNKVKDIPDVEFIRFLKSPH
ncbi:MAG TPA: nucleotide-binding protein [Pyrinomonadaceae bacterium]|jgi:hypothetical protein